MLKKLVICFFLLLSLDLNVSQIKADDLNNDGYSYSNGYWWRDGVGYLPYKVYYYDRCRRYRWYWAWKPVSYNNSQYGNSQYNVSSQDENWRSKLLDIAANRDKYELSARRSAIEQEEFLESVQALGLSDNFHIQGYGQPVQYSQYEMNYNAYPGQVASAQSYAPQGQTVYGYSTQTLSNLYGNNDLSVLYNQAGRVVENAQTLAGQANSDFQTLVRTEGDNRSRVAEILAKGQAAREALQATNAQGSAQVTTLS